MTRYQFQCWKRKMRKEDMKRLSNCEGYVPKDRAWWYEGGFSNYFWWKDWAR